MIAEEQPVTATRQQHVPAQPAVRLGTAVVIESTQDRTQVVFEGGMLNGRLALAFAYQPVAGDVVLVIIQDQACFVIGVLSGRGAITLNAPGDITISAPNGRISLNAGESIEVDAGRFKVHAQSIEVLAVALVERVQSAFKTFTDLLHITAGRRQTTIDGVSMESTGRTYQRSAKETVINGESINIT
jgi:hypothetical protein